MILRGSVLAVLAASLIGCATPPAPPPDSGFNASGCGADNYQSFVGTPLAAASWPSDLNVRVIGPGEAVTLEFDPTRMNMEVDEAGIIQRIYCG